MQPVMCGCWSLEREKEEEGGRVWARARDVGVDGGMGRGSSLASRSEVEGARV